ncbi:Glutamate decarboxylase [Phytophthora citrophthora]|uniref:glutamate decarboxylase n=1 Tax=Phytophthora citrophthora TaxID=4793 RepID=A0AAD9LD15_9STRA|nr:Glutamate decarboxylase [Phytophthora citrophthora]
MLVEENERHGWLIQLHVDAASGGFIAPFISLDLLWDFRLPNVKSINVSGHKFGLVYAGMGWAIWREKEDLPDDLVFHVNYLGGDQSSFTLNFFKGAGNVVAQYYNLLRFGFDGYLRIMEASMENAAFPRKALIDTGLFNIVDKAHMPLVAFSLKDSSNYNYFDIQEKLKGRDWIVPAYTCSKGAESLTIMRIVVKQNISCQMAKMLVQDILHAVLALDQHSRLSPAKTSMAASMVAVHPMPAIVKIKRTKISSKAGNSAHKCPRRVTHLTLCI